METVHLKTCNLKNHFFSNQFLGDTLSRIPGPFGCPVVPEVYKINALLLVTLKGVVQFQQFQQTQELMWYPEPQTSVGPSNPQKQLKHEGSVCMTKMHNSSISSTRPLNGNPRHQNQTFLSCRAFTKKTTPKCSQSHSMP